MRTTQLDPNELIAIADVRAAVHWWPYSSHGTYRLIRQGRLGCVKIGGKRYLTPALLAECVARHTEHVQLARTEAA